MYRLGRLNTGITTNGSRVKLLTMPKWRLLKQLPLIVVFAYAAYIQPTMAATGSNFLPSPFTDPIYGSKDRPIKFECFSPSDFDTEVETTNRLAYAVGVVTIYPRGRDKFLDLEQCLFGWYASKKIWLVSLTWDTTHALLKLMSADPEQFFRVIKNKKPEGYSAWVRSFEHAQLWGMSNECPNPTPLAQAARSISGFTFPDADMERMRKEVLGKLITLKCEVPQ